MYDVSLSNYKSWDQALLTKPTNIKNLCKHIIECGILAPSIHNTQPWKFEIVSDSIIVYPLENLQLPIADVSGRGLFISIGCCLFNMEVAANKYGYEIVTSLNENDKSILLKLKKSSKNFRKIAKLYNSIFHRRSDKNYYSSTAVSQELIKELVLQLRHKTPVHIELIYTPYKIQKIAELYKKAALFMIDTFNFGREISQWVRPNNTTRFDGMPGFVSGMPFIMSLIGSMVLKFSKKPLRAQALADFNKLSTSPLVGYISTADNTINSWINVGKAYENLALAATAEGISCTPMAAFIENDLFAKKFLEIVENESSIPHMFFRLGYSNTKEVHTPRRPLEYCLS